MMVLNNETSIKENLAFPTTGSGRTAVMDAPARLSREQLQELDLEIVEKK
jgi:aspartyl-tRNA synthetase